MKGSNDWEGYTENCYSKKIKNHPSSSLILSYSVTDWLFFVISYSWIKIEYYSSIYISLLFPVGCT